MTTKRFTLAALVLLVASSLLGCATLQEAGSAIGLTSGSDEPSLMPTEEGKFLYARGLREAFKGGTFLKELKMEPTERVWVVNKNKATNGDGTLDAITYDALVDSLRADGLTEVVERDDDLMRAMYLEYTESGKLDARDPQLVTTGRVQNADVILAYRVMRLNYRSPGLLMLGIRMIAAGFLGLCTDAQMHLTDGLRIAVHLDVIDVKTGKVRSTKIVEHVEPQPKMFAGDAIFN